MDSDGDGIGNNADPDDDNDGIPDSSDAFPLDAGKVIHIAACTIYAVNDQGSNNSQFFTINPVTRQVAALGALRNNYDIEGLAVDPATGIIYATSGTHNIGPVRRAPLHRGRSGRLAHRSRPHRLPIHPRVGLPPDQRRCGAGPKQAR